VRTLVTGGAGFIGSNLVDRFLADGAQVIALDNFDSFYPESRKRANLAPALQNRRFRLMECEICDRGSIDRIVLDPRPEDIVHLAARAGVRLTPF
jgi:nucleoside-diphosphate-sugar epimerase